MVVQKIYISKKKGLYILQLKHTTDIMHKGSHLLSSRSSLNFLDTPRVHDDFFEWVYIREVYLKVNGVNMETDPFVTDYLYMQQKNKENISLTWRYDIINLAEYDSNKSN